MLCSEPADADRKAAFVAELLCFLRNSALRAAVWGVCRACVCVHKHTADLLASSSCTPGTRARTHRRPASVVQRQAESKKTPLTARRRHRRS
ncbi:hypothetical protein MTO96_022156 [Rhipicephalus appendiculatus]